MTDQPTDIREMIRRALSVQVELGVSEAVLRPAPSGDEELRTDVVSVANAIACADQFGLKRSEDDSPGYGSVREHCNAICDCQLCSLGATRNKFVYGVGNPEADLMFVGEAPGADEDRIGEPFIGRAGQLLDRILNAIGFQRDEIYIANILKCRPPGNRDPQPEEMKLCTSYLREQIHLIQPQLICALGRIAAQSLLQTTTPLGKLRGRFHDFAGVPLLVTYHPAALLRFPGYKKDTWADMQTLRTRYDELTQG